MRIRKYRVWVKQTKKMISDKGIFNLDLYNEIFVPSEEYICMDYINLKDRHGKEIYEHDLITLYPGGQVRLVIWQDQYSGWVAQKKMEDGSKHVVFFYNQKEKNNTIEVVGNLYEHPELWKSS